MKSSPRSHLAAVLVSLLSGIVVAGGEEELLIAVNLNGPPAEIEGRKWMGGTAVEDDGMARFENEQVRLKPEASPSFEQMIRSSVWHGSGKNRITVGGLPDGELTVFLYVW